MTLIHIGNLADDTDAAQARALFERYGDIVSMCMKHGGSGHRFTGFGLIEMEESAARRAIVELDGSLFNGAILSVTEATESRRPVNTSAPVPSLEDAETSRAVTPRRFEVTEVKKVEGPGGSGGNDWYRYVLSQGASRITGFHRGTLEEVTEYAVECGAAFNERNQSGRSTYAYARRKK
jgi:RNA recognition motif-containing protein